MIAHSLQFLSEDRLHYRSQRTKELDTMLGDLHCEIRDLETAVMTQLQEKVVEKGPVLYQVMEYSAQLDCLISLALASREFSYCRPTLSTEHSISIRDCRWGWLCSWLWLAVMSPLPCLSLPLSQVGLAVFMALVGSNVSSLPCLSSFLSPVSPLPPVSLPLSQVGLAVFMALVGSNVSSLPCLSSFLSPVSPLPPVSLPLSQVGLAVFMALVGSNVPASEAHIGLVDGIYTRMQSRESVSVGLSTFMIDLNQVDGLSLLASSLRHWLHPGQACPHVFISTNFHSLFQLNLLPESPLLSYQTLETAVDGEELVFFYQLREGVSTSSYAANIATLAGMPAKIVQRGVEVRGADTHLEPACEAALHLPVTSIF
ncbi:UNVERIFIED_CONTAM: hypothetical protein FKN15_004725 [Acipenser sinensis]